MKGARRNAMLIELVIVILFFCISVSVVMQLFVAAGLRSTQSRVDNAALLVAEDVAERFAASDLPVEDFLLEAGFAAEGNAYTMASGASDDALTLRAEVATEDTGAGVLDSMLLTAYEGERAAIELPLRRYLPRGGVQ